MHFIPSKKFFFIKMLYQFDRLFDVLPREKKQNLKIPFSFGDTGKKQPENTLKTVFRTLTTIWTLLYVSLWKLDTTNLCV